MLTCREPDYVAHGKKEVGKVEKHNALLRVEEPGMEVWRQEVKQVRTKRMNNKIGGRPKRRKRGRGSNQRENEEMNEGKVEGSTEEQKEGMKKKQKEEQGKRLNEGQEKQKHGRTKGSKS